MQFNKLRLLGFKSFVDPTELVIAPGLTGVVGPNGCGKSNLLEALRWVMGENRPSAMRGGGMEDVIFAGASSRPARNYAEVTLHLDNSDRLAPAGFNENDSLEIIRRITRDTGSAYRVNGKDTRARDVQMLFADASTGAHSPALVRQGQISELINAKPKARRRILEEAAGISGLYQRRHEAELKLKATEANLERVEDVLESLRGQLASLAKQARQAKRYREIGTALRAAEGTLLLCRWHGAETERQTAEAGLREATVAAGRAQTEAAQAAKAREAADAAMPPLREEETVSAAILQRHLVARDALDERENRAKAEIAQLSARVEQYSRDAEREQKAISEASEGQDDALAEAQSEARGAADGLKRAEAEADRVTEDTARLSARHQSADRRLEDARGQIVRIEKDLAETQTALERLREERAAAEEAHREAAEALEAAQAQVAEAEAALSTAETARGEAQGTEGTTRGALAEAEGEVSALAAEVSGLERLLAREKGDGPQILDEIRVAPGYEAALGAALGDDLKAPQIGAETESGWRPLEALEPAPLPAGAEPIGPHVTAPDVLTRRLAHVGLVSADKGAELQPLLKAGQRLVSPEGDLWRWDGYTLNAADAPSAAALRLQQVNRLEALRTAQAKAEAAAAERRAAHDTAKAALGEAQSAEAQARSARKTAEQAASDALRAAGRAETNATNLAGRLETVEMALSRRQEDLSQAKGALGEAEAAKAELEDLGAARAAQEDSRGAVEAARAAMLEKRAAHDELRGQVEARRRRSQEITKEISGWRHRLQTATARIEELDQRIEESRKQLAEAQAQPEEILIERNKLVEMVASAEGRCKAAGDALAAGETALREAEAAERAAERAASEAREARARAEAMSEAAAARVAETAERIEEAGHDGPEALLASLELDLENLPAAQSVEIETERLRRQRDALGAVNLRAEEDSVEVQTEFDNLTAEKEDLEAAIAKLRHGIGNLNREGRQRLLAAFDQVNGNFSTLFRTLFGGGDASLVLVESEDPLEAGLEIMCQPPGKKLSTLSLLSGGEQTLTALSLIFAVFLANPSPICVLDEVDAPLDDANVTRFCDLLDEMTNRTNTRFLIITHHAVTMARMDRLFGVTMMEQGVSQLVSVDLARAAEMVDA